MIKIPLTLLIALCSTLFTNGATAQNQPLACQVEAAAGLRWENGRWDTKTFVETKFILVQAGNTLTTDSVAKVMISFPPDVTCKNDMVRVQCADLSGGVLFFDKKTLKGGTAMLFGSISPADRKDTVAVQVFSCTPF